MLFTRSIFPATISVVLLAVMGISTPRTCRAQTYTKNYDFPNDQKLYSTEIVTGTQHESVMAGTVYRPDADGGNVVHFLHLDVDGTILASQYYDDPDYIDERSVDIEPVNIAGNNWYIITCLVRPDFSAPTTIADRIKLIIVDVNGVVQSSKVIYENQARGLYPTHSVVFHDNLFICGYQTEKRYIHPDNPSPSEYGDRKGFVMKVDPNSISVINTLTMDYTYSNPVSVPVHYWQPHLYDYDMPLRLVRMRDGSDNLYVTGSITDVSYEDQKQIVQTQRMATMSIVIDQNLNIVYDKPFRYAVDMPFLGEYGVGLYQDMSFTPVRNYIVGNLSNPISDGSSSSHFMITYVDQNFDFATSTTSRPRVSFLGFDGAWALSTFDVYIPNGGRDGTVLGLAGMQDNANNGCHSIQPWHDNVNPYLMNVALFLGSGPSLSGRIENWVTFMNKTGTGDPANDINAYRNLGGDPPIPYSPNPLSNVFKHTVFAARNSINDDFILSAPKWNGAGNSLLNLKSVRAKFDDYTVPSCSSSYAQTMWPDPCADGLNTASFPLSAPGIPAVNDVIPVYSILDISDVNTVTVSSTYSPDALVDCNAPGGPHFKNAATNSAAEAPISVTPNPALGILNISGATNVKYTITDVVGTIVMTGIIADSQINIGALSAGGYILSIEHDRGDIIHSKFVKH